jgi:hypothetical protein
MDDDNLPPSISYLEVENQNEEDNDACRPSFISSTF